MSVEEKFSTINGFKLANADKIHRAVFGNVGREGKEFGGVGEDAAPEVILAAYDKLGGLILKGTSHVKTGSFYDFEKKTARAKPEVVFVFRDLASNVVEVPEDQELPIEVRAAQAIKANKVKKPKKVQESEDEGVDA